MRDGKPHDGKMLGPFLGWAFLFGGGAFYATMDKRIGRTGSSD